MAFNTKAVKTRAANKWETKFLLSVVKNGKQSLVDWVGVGKDMGIATSQETMVIYGDMMKALEAPFIEPCLSDATIEQLNTMLIDKERGVANIMDDITAIKDQIIALEEELEVKRAMKVVEDRIKAEHQLLDEKEGRIKQLIRHILMEKKRKRVEVEDVEEGGEMDDVKVKRERL